MRVGTQHAAMGWPPREAATPGHGRCGRCGRLMLTRGVWQQAETVCFSCRSSEPDKDSSAEVATRPPHRAKWVA
ncbi:MAG: hypothetical protein ACO3OV_07360 [Steroidobacteraceae bacterium]